MNFELGPSAMCRRRQIFEDKQARFTITVLWLLFLIVKSEVKQQIGRRWHCIDFCFVGRRNGTKGTQSERSSQTL